MATEGAARRCPVCDESLPERPPSCFRCETPLRSWWPLDEALAPEDPVPAGVPGARAPSARLLAAAAFVAGGALTVLLTRTAQAPTTEPGSQAGGASPVAAVAPVASEPVAATGPRPPVVRYHVQPGDSLWRVAAALTGEGHRWRELWPAEAADPRRLQPGTVLEIHADATRPLLR